MTSQERLLDRALAGAADVDDAEITALTRLADEVEANFAVDVPPQAAARALFVHGVAARQRRLPWLRLAAPAMAVVALLAIVMGVAGRRALPGDVLYPVRNVLHSVGLASSVLNEAREAIADAEDLLARGESVQDEQPARAEALAVRALLRAGEAAALADELEGRAAAELRGDIDAIKDRAAALIAGAGAPRENERVDEDEEAEAKARWVEDDSSGPSSNSGPGSGDDDEDDDSGSDDGDGDGDNSGSGSGDSDDDSGDRLREEEDVDRSGSGGGGGDSDDSDSDDSGSGNGDDLDDSDNSGPGSAEDLADDLDDDLDEES